jgi:hypothetical protein
LTIPREGQSVSYIGDGRDGRALGERGKVLSVTGRSGHVKWADQTITLVDLDDVAPLRGGVVAARVTPVDELDDSLEVGFPVQAGLRTTLMTEGALSALDMLASSGQVTGFAAIAESARTHVENQVRTDPGFLRATAGLDDDEVDELVSTAAVVLLRDTLGSADA